ncbi:MAG: preprotein translocase subunit YajC [Actinobacteria bacterium]|nr:preprotein translocase subunit YajC [Actinomycetota bacterium]
MASLIIIVVMLVLMWLLLIRPQRRRQSQQAQMLSSLELGDEILTAGGLFGHVVAIDGDQVTVEIAPGTNVRVARRAVSAVIPDEADDEPGSDEELDAEAEPGAEPNAPEVERR